ncbi:hypothetical protein ET495_06070 [Xylanimonas allomyrinae]|uniref:DUF6318 domain-containing protein n=1 Tax=Xylanimonas allomyrinae TaxID=2509459 RepID=A0A4P6EJY2_9MICO|nr:DUF6318 family protein [Xylanimonas allomyrinae]QAY62884.1 hypothetical protein ET495_06070 [Xylanimonas allomyrinae]
MVIKPARPAAMDDDGPAGAEAAARYFLELDSYMQATGDTTEWEAMSHQSCEFCAKRRDQARQIAANGDIFSGGVSSVQVVDTYVQEPTTGLWPVDLELHESATTITDDSGEAVYRNAANSHRTIVKVGRRDNQWVIVVVGHAAS